MIHVIGDSHALYTFNRIEGVEIHHIGAITLKRISHLDEDLLLNTIRSIKLLEEDVIVLSFGEIDMRCYVKPNLMRKKQSSLEQILSKWAEDYVKKIVGLNIKNKIFIMSVVPPSFFEKANSSAGSGYPVAGTDEERAQYTKTLNEILKNMCEPRGVFFLDIYSKYADENGMLPPEKCDGSVHIINTDFTRDALIELGLISADK